MSILSRCSNWLPFAAAAVLLVGAGADRLSLPLSRDAEPYHRALREKAARFVPQLSGWQAQDLDVPAEAITCLKPNIMISRRYTNPITGEEFSLLFEQCSDVRDLVPHYPPKCYPGRGLDLTEKSAKCWNFPDRSIPGTEYQFESNGFVHNDAICVENFMVLPIGQCVPEMTQVQKQVALSARYFGAAEVQLVFSSHVTAPRRDQIVQACVSAYLPLIDAIEHGVPSPTGSRGL